MNNNDYLMDLANNGSVKEQFPKDQFPEGLLERRHCCKYLLTSSSGLSVYEVAVISVQRAIQLTFQVYFSRNVQYGFYHLFHGPLTIFNSINYITPNNSPSDVFQLDISVLICIIPGYKSRDSKIGRLSL